MEESMWIDAHGRVDPTYIQLQNNSETVVGQRYWRANGNYEHGYDHMFNFWKVPTEKDIGQHLRGHTIIWKWIRPRLCLYLNVSLHFLQL